MRPYGLRPVFRLAALLVSHGDRSTPSSRLALWNTDSQGSIAKFFEAPWILCTLPPSFAISAQAEPVAVVLNMTGERFARNRKIKAIQEFCGDRFANGPSAESACKTTN